MKNDEIDAGDRGSIILLFRRCGSLSRRRCLLQLRTVYAFLLNKYCEDYPRIQKGRSLEKWKTLKLIALTVTVQAPGSSLLTYFTRRFSSVNFALCTVPKTYVAFRVYFYFLCAPVTKLQAIYSHPVVGHFLIIAHHVTRKLGDTVDQARIAISLSEIVFIARRETDRRSLEIYKNEENGYSLFIKQPVLPQAKKK